MLQSVKKPLTDFIWVKVCLESIYLCLTLFKKYLSPRSMTVLMISSIFLIYSFIHLFIYHYIHSCIHYIHPCIHWFILSFNMFKSKSEQSIFLLKSFLGICFSFYNIFKRNIDLEWTFIKKGENNLLRLSLMSLDFVSLNDNQFI